MIARLGVVTGATLPKRRVRAPHPLGSEFDVECSDSMRHCKYPYISHRVRRHRGDCSKGKFEGAGDGPEGGARALGIAEGDEVVFRVEGNRAVLARTPDFLTLAGTIKVPAALRNVAWDDIIRKTRATRATKHA